MSFIFLNRNGKYNFVLPNGKYGIPIFKLDVYNPSSLDRVNTFVKYKDKWIDDNESLLSNYELDNNDDRYI